MYVICFFICGPLPNDSRTSTSPRPGGWGPLTYTTHEWKETTQLVGSHLTSVTILFLSAAQTFLLFAYFREH